MLCPAEVPEAAQLSRIAVLPFSGPGGDQITVDVEALLVGIRVNDNPHFNVIERAALKKIVKEQSLHLTGVVDEKTAVTVGKLAGAEGMVFGTVTQNSTEDSRYSAKRSECVSKDKDGNCTKQREDKVGCTKRNAYFTFVPKVISVSTGQILVSQSLSGHTTDDVCQDSGRPLRSKGPLLSDAKRVALNKFRRLIAPYHTPVEIRLLEKDDTQPSDEAKEKVANGIKWAKAGRTDRACELWKEAHQLHAEGYAIPYLLGVCAELSGRLDHALSYYNTADENTSKPVKEINNALQRVRQKLEKQR